MREVAKKQYKKYSLRLLSAFFLLIFTVAIFNIAVDPFKIFNFPLINHFNAQKPDLKRQQRVTKIVELKLDKKPLDSVFLGSSRVDGSVSADYYEKLTGRRTKNLGMNALSHSETIKIANNVILIHPEIKKIYVGLDFFRFTEKNAQNKRPVPLSNNPKLTISEFNPVVLSLDTIISSVNTVIYNIKYKPINVKSSPVGTFERTLNNYAENYYEAVLALDEFEKLYAFKKDMKQKGIDVIFYLNPTHASDLSMIKQSGCLDVFNEWKERLAEKFDYVDFDFVNDITAEKVDENTKYFAESSHSTPIMGELIMDNLINSDNFYGVKITAQNVKQRNSENEKALNKWEKENPDMVKNIRKYIEQYKQELDAEGEK